MTKQVFQLDTKAGIQRDGTVFDNPFYTDGLWVRFQRGRPRKIYGYTEITPSLAGPSRGIYVSPQNGFTNVYSGYSDGLQVIPINSSGTGGGISDFTLSNFTASSLNVWQFDNFFDSSGSGNNLLLAHPGQNLAVIDSTTNTPVLAGALTGTTASKVGVFTQAVNTTNGSVTATLNYPFTNQFIVGAGQTITGTGIPSGTTVTGVVANTLTLSAAATATTGTTLSTVAVTGTAGQCSCTATTLTVGQSVFVTGTNSGTETGITAGTYYIIATNGTTTFTLSGSYSGTAITTTAGTTTGLAFVVNTPITATFDNNISVSGGVIVLFPYVFVYGNNGLIQNSGAGNVNDWVSATANATNVATGKIVQGYPIRGGTNSPAGLFWSLDSVIRVSFTPTTTTVGNTSSTFYWRYDTITSQSSILSSQSVIEYDGIFYWCGVDRFLLYNGVVKEIPNGLNQNYFFDNLNYAQRQKVYATKVTRFGEIWWFYPNGSSTECNNAIIYNVRENTWYDAGFAAGARRSAGYFSQVFHYPINADWQVNASGGVNLVTIGAPGSSYTNGTYSYYSLTGGTGTGATATITVAGGVVTAVVINNRGINYTVGDTLSAVLPAGSGFRLVVNSTMTFVSLYQHEIGVDAIKGGQVLAIPSYFETNNLGFVSGGPAQETPVSINKWLRVERVEPDFVMSGQMQMYITGPSYAQGEDKLSGPYLFEPNTTKIDLKEQRRQMRIKFVSNVQGGNYFLGKLLLDADFGDVRGYS